MRLHSDSLSSVRPGGPAVINGVVYQMLWSLFQALKMTVCSYTWDDTAGSPSGSTFVLEPDDGGDLQTVSGVGLSCEQVKARPGGGTWSLREVIDDVLPDLYRAVDLDHPANSYRFVTEGRIGAWRDVYEGFFRTLNSRMAEEELALQVLDDQEEFASKARNPGLASALGQAFTERGLFDHIVSTVRSREPASAETLEVTQRQVADLLRRFEFVGGRSEVGLEAWIDAALLDCGVASDEVANKRRELSFALMEHAKSQEGSISVQPFLESHGVAAVRLTNAARLRDRAREALQRYLASHGYSADDDVRGSREGPLADLWGTGKPVRVFAGESGQGKSWAMWRTASVLADGGSLVVAVDAAATVDGDLARAASTFCHQVWRVDSAFSFVRLRERVARLCSSLQMPWLTLFVDGVDTHKHADELLCTDWDSMGVRVAFTFANAEQLGHDARRGIVRVMDFTLEELTSYLQRRLGQAWADVPEDVRGTLRRPLLARIYCELFENAPDWRPTNEYELYWCYWGRVASRSPVATGALGRLAVLTLDGLSYPWPVSAAADAGLRQGELEQLARLGLIRQATEGRSIEIWHDRILNWAVAEGVVASLRARRIDEARLCEYVNQCLRSESFGYVVMDLFWLLTDPSSGVHDCIPRLLELLDQDFTTRGVLTLLRTLGDRILPAAFVRLRNLSAQPDSLAVNEYIRVVAAVGTPAVPEKAREFLSANDVGLQRTGTQILTKCPTPDALDRLWELRCALPDDEEHWRDLRENTAALASCVELDHEWLKRAILRAVPEEPVHELAYRLANLSNGRGLWPQLKQDLFAKVSPEKERCLAVCIGQFQDEQETAWLEARLGKEEDLIGASALRALYRVAPDKAVAMAHSVSLKHLYLARNWTVGPMLDLSAEATLEKLDAMIRDAQSPWEAARILDGRANAVSPGIVDILLDALELDLEGDLSEPGTAASHRLFWPLSWLAGVWRLDLLSCLERRKGSSLESKLARWLVQRGPRQSIAGRWEEDHALTVLHKMGGSGFPRVVNDYLGADSSFGRMDGLGVAAKRPDEETVRLLVGIAEREELWNPEAGKPFPVEQVRAITALAEMGKWDIVVKGMLKWGWFLPPGFALYAEEHSFTDCELSPAVEALQAGKGNVGAIRALGLTGRQEFLPRVLSALRSSEEGSDLRQACLMALRDLPDRSVETEDLFIEHLNNPATRYIAWTALLQFGTEGSRKALLACLRRDTKVRSDADWLLGLNLLVQESTREEAARLLWDNSDAFHLTWHFGSRLDLFACLQDRAVADTLREIAFADRRHGLADGVNIAGMRGLASFDGPAAWLAATKALRAPEAPDRERTPALLLALDSEKAVPLLFSELQTAGEGALQTAIAEGLARSVDTSQVIAWLSDSDARQRKAAWRVAARMHPSEELEEAIAQSAYGVDLEAADIARWALRQLRRTREVARLIDAFLAEADPHRRWVLLDCALEAGYVGLGLDGAWPEWAQMMAGAATYPQRKYMSDALRKRRRKLLDDLRRADRRTD